MIEITICQTCEEVRVPFAQETRAGAVAMDNVVKNATLPVGAEPAHLP